MLSSCIIESMTESPEILEPLSAETERQHRIWRHAERIRRWSDRVVGVGPFGVGLDGILTWVPGLGSLYTLGAAIWLIVLAARSDASAGTHLKMIFVLLIDLLLSPVPLVGDAADLLFPGHHLAARTLQKDIERRHGPVPMSTNGPGN